jgi:hypothetical protein
LREFGRHGAGRTLERAGLARLSLVGLAVVISLLLRTSVIAAAADITVCSAGCDHTSIQAAIDAAAAGDTIVLAAETFTETIVVDRNLTIRGAGSGASIIDGDAAGTGVTIPAGVSVNLESLSVRNGRTTGNGGGILNEGTLVARHIAVSGNVAATVASSAGGGIYSTGRLTVEDSTVSVNESQRGGGGVYVSGPAARALIERTSIVENRVRDLTTDFRGGGGVHVASGDATIRDSSIVGNRTDFTGGGLTVRGSGAEVELINSTIRANASRFGAGIITQTSAQLTITGSTISDNSNTTNESSSGGGIRAQAQVTLRNSTIAGNSTGGSGGGIHAEATVRLDSVTIAGNSAANGGGIASFAAGTTLIDNTIVAGNAASSAGADCGGSLDGGSGLLIADPAGCTTSAVTGVIVADALLGPLQDNGGPTLTMLPGPSSPAIDAGSTGLTADQRGLPRPVGAGPDLGSVELQPFPEPSPSPSPTPSPSPSPTPTPSLVAPTDLSAEALSMDTIRLQWTDSSTGEDGYEIQRHDGVDFVRLVLLPPDFTTYMDQGLERNTMYVYRVRSFVGTTQFSDFSDIAAATTHDLDPGIVLPFIFVNDPGDDDTRDGVMTLREAILVATGELPVDSLDEGECGQLLNTAFDGSCTQQIAFGAWSIRFDEQEFPAAAPTTIALSSSLPPLDPGGHDIATAGAGVIVDGQTRSFDCFIVASDDNVLQGLQVVRCAIGVWVSGAEDNLIGGTSTTDRNVISGNNVGVLLDGSSSSNAILGNYIGSDSDGVTPLRNGIGVSLFQAHSNQIGNGAAGGGNLISGNGDGVRLSFAISNHVEGNRIGTDAAGSERLANSVGVRINAGIGNTIGTGEGGNLISGNSNDGVLIDGTDGPAGLNVVAGNLIGLEHGGSAALPNGNTGVRLVRAVNNVIGGVQEESGNVISGNSDDGIRLISESNANRIQGNLIGTNAAGSAAVANDRHGIALSGGSDNIIGGTDAGAANVISGNGLAGIDIRTSNTVVQGNLIGTDAAGSTAIPNSSDGVTILGGDDNVIGGTDPSAGNVVSGNGRSGIYIGGDGNRIEGNLIGTDITGEAALANAQNGIHVDGGDENLIGGVDPLAGNVISGNARDGIFLGGVANRIQHNYIGTDSAAAWALPNMMAGIHVGQSSGAAGTVAAADNLIFSNTIAHNRDEGVWVEFVAGEGNTVRFNSIHENGREGLAVHKSAAARPLLNAAVTDDLAGPLVVDVALAGERANTTYLIDVYANQECDDSGRGEGERYVATTLLRTDGDGNASGQLVAGQPVAPGEQLTATATDELSGTTFEFSACLEATEPPVIPAGELNVRCTHSPVWPQPGETVTVTAEALDGALDPVLLADEIEIWVGDTTAPAVSGPSPLGIRAHATAPLSAGFLEYGCRVGDGGTSAFTGWRKFTIGDDEPAITVLAAVPVLFSNAQSRAIDIVFIADEASYSGSDDPAFQQDVESVIRSAYYAKPLFLSNQSRLNFWIAQATGRAFRDDDDKCVLESPSGWNTKTVFADVGAILHVDPFRDCAKSNLRLFSSEPTSPLTVLHETGHAPFGLADEYAPDGGYFQTAERPNVYTSLFACLVDATTIGRTPDDCREWKRASDSKSFWTSDPSGNDLMESSGDRDPQLLDTRRIEWMFEQCAQGNC